MVLLHHDNDVIDPLKIGVLCGGWMATKAKRENCCGTKLAVHSTLMIFNFEGLALVPKA
jgi:hypothetical protein